jgi:hypothetical protein
MSQSLTQPPIALGIAFDHESALPAMVEQTLHHERHPGPQQKRRDQQRNHGPRSEKSPH